MKNKFTKVLSVLMAMTMLFSLAACGGKEAAEPVQEAAAEAPAETVEEPAAEAVETEAAEVAEAEEEPYELRIFLSGYKGVENAPRVEKYITSELEKACNIKVVFEEVPGTAYDEKVALSMADGDYPDVYLFNSHEDSNLRQGVQNGIIIPINDYLDGYENVKKYTYESALNAAKINNDENIYLLPRTSVARSDGFIVRADWMEKLGIEVTNDDFSMTPEEFLDMMKRFTEEDPDGDGVDNTYGYIFRATNGIITPIFTGAFGVNGWQPSDGEYKYMNPCYEIGNESYRKALEFNRELFKYSHPDSAITSDWHSLLWNGSAGVASEFAGWLLTNKEGLQEINPDGDLTYVCGISNEDGELKNVANGVGIWGGFAITTACERPEKVMEMMDFLLSDQGWEYILYGEPGYTYNKDDSGMITVDADNWGDFDRGIYTSIARRAGDGDFFIDKSLSQEDKDTLLGYIDISCESAVMSMDSGKIPEINSDIEFSEVENKRKEVETKIIMGVADISEYDAVLEQWYAKGGKEYVEQMNALIDSVN